MVTDLATKTTHRSEGKGKGWGILVAGKKGEIWLKFKKNILLSGPLETKTSNVIVPVSRLWTPSFHKLKRNLLFAVTV